MESYKFYVIHVLLDTVLAAIVFILFYVGWSNTLSIAAIPNTVVLLLICFIGYKTITMKGFINSLADVSITILVYIGYLYAVHNYYRRIIGLFRFLEDLHLLALLYC